MKKYSWFYNIINIAVLLLATLVLLFNYNVTEIIYLIRLDTFAIILITVILVHFLKAFRLYLAFYGTGISISTYAKTYCKVTPVSLLLPLKTGELFRMYCYGHHVGMLKGVVTVLLDRFMDTVALVTVIVAVWIFRGAKLIPLAYLLLVFIFVAILIYVVFPGLYTYWKKYILSADATPRNLSMLKTLENTNIVYKEVSNITQGRGIILYVLSLIAWGAEIGSVLILNELEYFENVNDRIAIYLLSALSKNQSIELKKFVLISIILLIFLYLVVKAWDVLTKNQKDKSENIQRNTLLRKG